MTIREITACLESIAPPAYQESYDNAGLITGSQAWNCTGAIIALDVTEAVVREAVEKRCNLVIAHHPIIFQGLKKLTGNTYVERTVIAAIRADVAIYAIHTNLDNVIDGVSGRMADLLDLENRLVLQPRNGVLRKLYTYVPQHAAEAVRQAIFDAGGGHIGRYAECSFSTDGTGTFKAGVGTNPYVGQPGVRHEEPETRLEVIFPAPLESAITQRLIEAHPYEEVAYDVVSLANGHQGVGSGIVGDLPEPLAEQALMALVRERFNLSVIRHTPRLNRPIKRVALCGGAGSFLLQRAIASGADAFITADMKYHEFFDADNRLIIMDIGHYESEQYTINLIYEHLQRKFSSFALLKTEVNTNPVQYFSE